MAREPTGDDINQFCEWTGLDAERDRTLVLGALKTNTTIDSLVGEFFEDPDSFRRKYTWDEAAFAADRDGGSNNTGIAFNIEAADNPANSVIQGVTPSDGYYMPPVGAPSRPPSRTNDRSPLGVPNSVAQEEEDLQRALRESAVESGVTPQEAGVTETIGAAPHFGPANRPDYDQNSWAMVPTAAMSSQTRADTDPPPSARKREPGAPAFLVQQPNARNPQHRLGSILTILHEIPLVRNVLLSTGEKAASYGHNSEWWKGQPIYAPHVLAAMQQGEQQGADDPKPNFYEEIHRLMAFLDQTERSYGSVEAMADLVPSTSYSVERQFYDTLADTTSPEMLKPLTHIAYPISTQTLDGAQESTTFAFLNFELTKTQYEQAKTLYEAWDWLVWNDCLTWTEITPETKMVVLEDMGEVMTVVIDGEGPPESMDMPAVWYPERYLSERKEEARVIQEHLAWVHRGLYQAQSLEYEYTNWIDPKTNKPHNKRDMLQKTIQEYEGQIEYLTGRARFRELQKSNDFVKDYMHLESVPCVLTEDEEELSKQAERVVKRCKWLLADLDEKMKKLNWERERLHERQKFLSSIFTDPDKPGLEKPFIGKRYLLRGVSTSRDVTYVCRRAEADLIDFDDSGASVDQWWRLSYTAGDSQPVKAERVSFDLVMRQMFLETKNPVLVYATDDAVNAPLAPLSDALQRFVRAENKNFRQELSQESTEESTQVRALNMSPISPSKRKYRSGSVDSMATNRASLGGSDTNSRAGDFDNDPFIGNSTQDTEMADLSAKHGGSETESKSLSQAMVLETPPGYDTLPPRFSNFGDNMPSTTDGGSDVSRTITPDVEEPAKGPEMQERNDNGGGSPFVANRLSMMHDPRDEQKTIKIMDMEIPDEHQ
ncbi:ubiquitin interaction domain-containing protein [Colletotrichum plurivorum]|uniref:Ubiquitin interaction domain-containing protein n=1 Tax=Colletotrichum plurivorum TaxID=2175906 RepID=A0A8H6NKU6_9PEZI|nr:ubiquitin interaction domain-containing protein [Colletotrichum plurivorum]